MTRDELLVFNVAAYLADDTHEKEGLSVTDLAAALTKPDVVRVFTERMVKLAERGEKYMEIYYANIDKPVQFTVYDGGQKPQDP